MAASQWPYTKTNLTNCALQCPTYDKKTNSILAFCENDNTPRFISGSMFVDEDQARKMFELIVKNNGKLVEKNVLKTVLE